MRLFEAIIDANHRAVAGDASAGLRPADFADNLPIIALTCIDPRLNALFPNVLGIPGDQFIWMRNAGNIVTGPLSSTMRSLALACAVKGGQEVAIIGHTDCQICKTTTMQLLDLLKTAGVERAGLPENLNEFFGMFATERQNVIKACDIVRHSPLIGPKIPVHGLLVDIETGKLEWLVNGYEVWQRPASLVKNVFSTLAGASTEELGGGPLAGFQFGEMKFPESKIGEIAAKAGDWLAKKVEQIEAKPAPSPLPSAPSRPQKIPLPPPIRPRIIVRREGN
ncbi:MAG: carbonic anhydrase [Verrucomicrobiales bacterium]|nr:carbonic anhydrase [Verrucomicrobiales bacterium]